jgi:hypothetical protein
VLGGNLSGGLYMTDDARGTFLRYSSCLLYWYKSTNTDAALYMTDYARGTFLRYSGCLLYWYKSTNTDAAGAAAPCSRTTARSVR